MEHLDPNGRNDQSGKVESGDINHSETHQDEFTEVFKEPIGVNMQNSYVHIYPAGTCNNCGELTLFGHTFCEDCVFKPEEPKEVYGSPDDWEFDTCEDCGEMNRYCHCYDICEDCGHLSRDCWC